MSTVPERSYKWAPKEPQTIEQAAEHYYQTLTRPLAGEKGLVETAFISGATSPEARAYWFSVFAKEGAGLL